jgi:hypothetical protein
MPVNRIRRGIIAPDMTQQDHKPRLIGSRLTAIIGVILTGYVAALTLRAAFWQHPRHFHWMLPLDHLLPLWAVLTANVALYACLIFLCIAFPRELRSKERVLVVGWIPGVLLSPIQGLVSVSLATAIQYVKAASMTVAFLAAVAILVEGPVSGNGPAEGTVPN